MVLTTSFPEKDYRGGEIVHHSAPSRDVTKIHLRNTPQKIHHQNTPPKRQKDTKTQGQKDKKTKAPLSRCHQNTPPRNNINAE